ncbi:hypothetical protein PAHAL_7G094100 [Panicum hallii]|jgi:hypothetical protein|uniref:Uncharacterized protein n=1 Tax=Panicum hallii TaxID=206008 RepID=A0A2T8IBL4_9POAL|nr:hypothetical protein PAHAL_7G094100 [Panicum hallii]
MSHLCTQHTLHSNILVTCRGNQWIKGLTLILLRVCNKVSCKSQIIFNITSTYISSIIGSNVCTMTQAILHNVSHMPLQRWHMILVELLVVGCFAVGTTQ